MATGFVLIKADPGQEQVVYERLLGVTNVEEIFPLFGEWDIIVKLTARDFDAMGTTIVSKIRTIQGVVTTYTLTATKL